ncbi:MAG: SDR family oxidoreductase [Nitrospiraceae bacterium]
MIITGGDGYLGLQVARRYLEETGKSVLLWVHATDRAQLEEKRQKVFNELGNHGSRLTFGHGDLLQKRPFQEIGPESVGAVIHGAAVTRFNVEEETARRVNIEGTEKLLDFAACCPSLEAIGLMSTVYASGLKPGRIDEVMFDGSEGFANHYERSKWTAEKLLLSRFAHLPWRIFRIATAIADDDSGHVTQQNAFHNTLKLFFYGLLSLIPGRPATPLYFVTGRFIADAVFELMQKSTDRMIFHVAHTRDESLSLGQLIDLAFDTFKEHPGFRLRRILKPLYADAEAFDMLVEGANSFAGAVVNQAVSSVAPFAKQLFIEKEVQNQRLIEHLSCYRAPDPRKLIRNTCMQLVQTRWGRSSPDAI